MAIPGSKPELEAAISARFDKLVAALGAVPDRRRTEQTMPGHARGTWRSPADFQSYLIGWNELVLKWLARDDQGQCVDFPETGYRWNELGELAQKFYRDHSAQSFNAKCLRLRAAKDQLLDEIAARSDAELYGAPWYGKWTKGRMIQLNSAAPCENARLRLRQWLRN